MTENLPDTTNQSHFLVSCIIASTKNFATTHDESIKVRGDNGIQRAIRKVVVKHVLEEHRRLIKNVTKRNMCFTKNKEVQTGSTKAINDLQSVMKSRETCKMATPTSEFVVRSFESITFSTHTYIFTCG